MNQLYAKHAIELFNINNIDSNKILKNRKKLNNRNCKKYENNNCLYRYNENESNKK